MGQKRSDIQGLRAVAVMAVISDHLFKWPSGGFVGVDVFFVVSGFLITGILHKEFLRTGTISFANFYKRRIRRIVPAATIVLASTCLLAVLLIGSRARLVALDALAGFLVFANWHFADVGTDYFQSGNAVSPLQHFWSLSVEEQFYFVWPGLLFLVLITAGKVVKGSTSRLRSLAVVVVVAVVVVASFLWSLSESMTNPTVAYFSTLTRAWELGVGAILALSAGAFLRMPSAVRTSMSYLGIVGIVSSMLVISETSTFPAPWALLPVVSTVLVLASGIGSDSHSCLLANPVSRFIGDISYSLYLWHFPTIVFLGVFIPTTSRFFYIVALFLMFSLAVISYRAVEQPFTSAPFLDRFGSGGDRTQALGIWWRAYSRRLAMGAIAVVLLSMVSAAVVGTYMISKGSGAGVSRIPESVAIDPTASEAATAMASDIAAAINAAKWPSLSPTASEVSVEGPVEDRAGCSETAVGDPASCAFGDPNKPSIVVFGDSTAITLIATVRAVYGEKYFIRGLTLAGCPVIDLAAKFDTAAHARACSEHRKTSISEIERLHPTAVIVSDNYEWSNSLNLRSGATGRVAVTEWATAAKSTVNKIAPYTAHIIFVTPPPQGKAIAECKTAVSVPFDCISEVPATWKTGQAAERSLVGGKIRLVNTRDWFCGQSGRCPAFASGTPTRRDGIHTSRQWALRVATLFRQETHGLIAL
ncbi:peptidoglycan/LPS O-acetylase OafA/YrhL [Cryobacterium sp. MP_M5]|uniref:acyltransferase family protein n=1 Tax=unclassified Cryobacterium TaxID=2649013 RepID=UPI0018CB94C4|nr:MULTISPECIES: acyltransferase family protein [unclassified Cryobacterium]MBG6057001.1 peptidoglycan/LPS O-acetylase OafA/YrhL [Cryobacterium sp. MP_M3]MEC5175200.1 peptidoglycan/LPS O-acetylase OafA/YrhL [Cryobacterium sp. MP_M5]